LKEYVQDGKTGLVVAPESPEAIVEGVKKFYALRDTVDFAKNIALWADTNLFQKIPEMIEDFLKRAGKAD
jgi:glycosyltransferase involved in cell wall biosynthesis